MFHLARLWSYRFARAGMKKVPGIIRFNKGGIAKIYEWKGEFKEESWEKT